MLLIIKVKKISPDKKNLKITIKKIENFSRKRTT